MLLCGIQTVTPGAIVGASIAHPEAPGRELLKPGAVLDAGLLDRLVKLGVHQIWVYDDATADLDISVAPKLTQAKLEVFNRLKQDLGTISRQTVSAAQVQSYRQSILTMVCQLIGDGKYANLTDTVFGCGGQAGHATNVAYLSVLVGLELIPYIIRERPRLAATHAKDMSVLGLAGMLHDVGKARGKAAAADHHEAHRAGAEEGNIAPEGYDEHTLVGYQMLRDSRATAAVTQAALNHHQRFDGKGWPDMALATDNRREGRQAGRQIHIFTRIVSAANVLDNLLRTAEGERLPPVAALHAFASARFDGWFDPIVRHAVVRRVPPFAVGSQVTLSDGRRSVVVAPNLGEPCRPVVRPLEPSGGKPAALVDLRDAPELAISHYLEIDVRRWLFSVGADGQGVSMSGGAEMSGKAGKQRAAA